MPLLHDPVLTLVDIRLRKIALSSLDLELGVRIENPNPLAITLKEVPFSILCATGGTLHPLAEGNTGPVKIAAQGTTLVRAPVRSQNTALISALAGFVTKGQVQVTVRGQAVVDAVLFSWPVPFEKTLPVTVELVTDTLAGTLEQGLHKSQH